MATERPQRERTGLEPSAELRKALDEADRSLAFFNDCKLIDWFESINKTYLSGQGTIAGPNISVWTDVQEDLDVESTLLEVNKTSSGVSTTLSWVDTKEDKKLRKVIEMVLCYFENTNGFEVILYSELQHTPGTVENGNLFDVGWSLQRNFYLNPEPQLPKYVDDLLLTFTNELFKSEIL